MIATLAMLSAITVSTKAQLNTAIRQARAGDVISLQRANYGTLNIENRKFTSPLTIRSVDPASPAIIAGLLMRKVGNFVFKDIEFTRVRGKESEWSRMVNVFDSADITFQGGFVHGPANARWQDDMNGMYFTRTTNIRISGVQLHDLRVALALEDSVNFTVENNVFSYISWDAIDIPGSRTGRIANNSIALSNINPIAHPDGVQCWTAGKTTGCKNIRITNNVFNGSPGNEFQGIFFGDEAKVGGYDDILISGNVFRTLTWHAINIWGRGTNQSIRDNTVIAGPRYRSWIRTIGAVTVFGNSAPTFVIAGKIGVPAGNREGGVYKP